MQEPVAQQKKSSSWKWLVTIVFFLAAAWFGFQMFGPDPPIIVSRTTTFLTEPLGEDGLPDYEAHLLQQGQAGVTPENNAAVLIWQAIWPGVLKPEHQPLLSRAIGLEKLPSASATLTPTDDSDLVASVSRDLSARFGVQLAEDEPAEYGTAPPSDSVEDWANELIKRAQSYAWTAEQLPALAAWAEQNQAPLDLLVEASGRSHYWSPSPSLLNDEEDYLMAMLLPEVDSLRKALRGLRTRAMWHVGAGRLEQAWVDLHACHRLARHLGASDYLVVQLVAIAEEEEACRGDAALLGHEALTPMLARKILDDLQQLPPTTDIARALDQGERLLYLDAIFQFIEERNSDFIGWSHQGFDLQLTAIVNIDWNSVLRDGNQWYDRIVAASRLPTYAARQAAQAQIDSELSRLIQKKLKNHPVHMVFSQQRRSEAISSVMASLLLPAFQFATLAEDRSGTWLDLTRVAAALAVYRAEQKEYPEQLEALVPELLPQLPIDLFSEKPFLYQRKEDGGFALYSVFVNGADDGGSNSGGQIVEGEWQDPPSGEFEYPEGDLVIRIPVPVLRLPDKPKKEPSPY